MRILFVGDLRESANGALFYSTPHKFVNGFVRNGHDVLTFSDRETARAATPFRTRSVGAGAMNRKHRATVENFAPDLVVLMHADMLETASLEFIKSRTNRPRIALINLDPLAGEATIRNVTRYDGFVDSIFTTTAGEPLRRLSRPERSVSFIPNPTCRAIDSMRAFENASPDYLLFYATRDGASPRRKDWCARIRQEMPHLKLDLRGLDGNPPVFGIGYLRALNNARMGLSLDGEILGNLYSSDRIAQYAGNGLLTLVDRRTGYDAIFSDDELAFFDDVDDLIGTLSRYTADDEAARRVARNGWARYHELFDVDLVARYIVEVTFGEPLSRDYAWPTELF
jgi:hypothetical protein